MQYIIVSSSKCDYQSWQLRLLEWSMRKVDQPGKLIILLSEDEIHDNEKPKFDFGDDVELIELPDWASAWKREHDDWWGGIPNKYESFNWIAEFYPFEDCDTLLFLDPDMIFIEKVELKPSKMEIIGQEWIGYRSLENWPQKDQAYMYPFALRFDTLKVIKDDFKKYCFKVRKEIKAWESDMWALDYAAANNSVKVKYIKRLGVCTIWKQNESEAVSPIIHYPNIVESAKGEKLFFKQDYTFQQDQNIDAHLSMTETDRKLLINISQERTDFIYHIKWPFEDLFKDYNGEDGVIILKPWKGGFNNIRMSLELAVCFSYLSNRSLVLPPSYAMYLLEGQSDFADFFRTDFLGISLIDYREFCSSNDIEESDEKIRAISKVVDYDSVGSIINFEKVPVPKSFSKGRDVINAEDIFDESDHIYFDANLLGAFYQSIYTSKDVELRRLIAKHVVYRNDIFDFAWDFINYFGDRTYYAIHVRRNDFQYKDLFISCEDILKSLKDIVPKYSTLYIATDHNDKSFFNPLSSDYSIVYYDTIAERLNRDPDDPNWIPIIEQLICTRAIRFIGMKLSTLSSYIFRLRGYMEDIEDKNYYLNGQGYLAEQQCDFAEDKQFMANWSREYKCSWDFTKKTIFLSIASYMDTQLEHTLISAINGVSDISRVVFGVHLQDTPEALEVLKAKGFQNIKIKFTDKDESKGVVWARNCIKRELYNNEDFFLQIDAHTRFKKNWDNILINQWSSIGDQNAIITTYPNNFDISDSNKTFLNRKNNSPLQISRFLTDHWEENRLWPRNMPSVKDYEIKECKWCAAGFLFAPYHWVRDIVLPDDIIFNGEEDLLTHLSFFQGYKHYTPAEATIWHNYNFKDDKTGIAYKEYNKRLKGDDSMRIINNRLFAHTYADGRSVEDLESYLNWKFRFIQGYSRIFVCIASYMDLDIRSTIESCLQNSKYPHNLSFGICWQFDESSAATEDYLDDMIALYPIKIAKHHYTESKGVGWARNKAAQFFYEETYFLQIDSHTRFRENWDHILIDNIKNLKKISDKPMISTMPPSYDMSTNGNVNLLDTSQLRLINRANIVEITDDFVFDYKEGDVTLSDGKHFTSPVLEPCFIFTEGHWVHNVSPDPNIYYLGEEVVLSIQSFNKGYDFYTPAENILWHRSSKERDVKHYNTFDISEVREFHYASMEYIKKIVHLHESLDLTDHIREDKGISEYERYVNANFRERKVGKFISKEFEFLKEPLKLGLITRCKDEFYVSEFCNYYLGQGVDQIHIIDDDSKDKSIYDDLLNNKNVTIHYEKNIVLSKYVSSLYKIIKDNFEWMIYVDVDEFITTKQEKDRTIRNILETEFQDVHCVKIPWVMMSSNGLQKSPESILESITYRWDHDQKHENKTSKHRKFRCRYDKIECKSIFKTAYFKDVFDHHPIEIINNQSIKVVESIKGEESSLSPYFEKLREHDIRNGILLCYHYRIISLEYAKEKIISNTWYKGFSIADVMSSDYPEILDETLKTKVLESAHFQKEEKGG